MQQMTTIIRIIAMLGMAPSTVSPLLAQAPGVPIEHLEDSMRDSAILAQANALKEAGKLVMNIGLAKQQLDAPVPGAVKFPKARKMALPGREITRIARKGHLQFGWYFLCNHCDNWHANLAGAYGVGRDAIATCYHCVDPGEDLREGYLIAVDYTGKVLPVTAVLSRSVALDGAILRVEGGKFVSLSFSDNVAPGDRAYCFSSPFGQAGYVSEGIVNRFFWSGPAGKSGTVEQWENLRINVSTDWAPGSSGSAVLDQAGNAIGHVSTIQPLSEDSAHAAARTTGPKDDKSAPDRFGGATLITLHNASAARGMLALAAGLRHFKPGRASVDRSAAPQKIGAPGSPVTGMGHGTGARSDTTVCKRSGR